MRFGAKVLFLVFLSSCLVFVFLTTAQERKEASKQLGGYRFGKEITLLSDKEVERIMNQAKIEPGGLLKVDDKLYLGPSLEHTKPIPIAGQSDPMSGKPDVLPAEVVQYLPPEIYQTLNAVKSIGPEDIAAFKALRSDDPNWNKNLVYVISKNRSTAIRLTGPATLIVVSLLDIPTNESGVKKYTIALLEDDEEIGTVTFNTPKMKKFVSSKPPNVQCGIPGVFTVSIPAGEHSYQFDLVSSAALDVGMRFFISE